MVHWKARGLFGVHRGELRTATAQWLREENAVFTVLWKSLRHGRPQRSSEPSHYSWESPNIVEKLFVKMPAQLFACLIWSSKEIHCSPNFVQTLSVKMPVHTIVCLFHLKFRRNMLDEPQTRTASEVIRAYTIWSEPPNIVQTLSVKIMQAPLFACFI